jgi:hypothetical protein
MMLWCLCVRSDPTRPTFTLTGLMGSTSYVYTVQAVNGVGSSNPSAPSAPVSTTGAGPPTVPRSPTIVPCDGHDASSMSVSWLPPVDEGGAVVHSYLIVVNASGPVTALDVAAVNVSDGSDTQVLSFPSGSGPGMCVCHGVCKCK